MDEFKREKDILDGVEASKKFEERIRRQSYTKYDQQDISLVRSEKRREERKKILDRIVPSRVCPACRNKIWVDSSWVINDNLAWCRSCYHSQQGTLDEETIYGSFVTKPIIRFEIDGWQIKLLRCKANVGLLAFSNRMGWTKSYQVQIESSRNKTLALDVIENLIEVFDSFGVQITDAV